MKIIRRIIAAVMVAAVSLTTLATTAFAWGKDLVDLSDDERFDELWKNVENSYIPLEASLMHDELKKFVSELDLETKIYGYDVNEGFKDFKQWYEKRHEGEEINTYNETVINYLREHPNADLRWTGTIDHYTVYDLNVLVYKGSHTLDDPYMQYDSKNIDDLIVWTYNSDKNQYEGKNISGKLIKKLPAYSIPYSHRESSKTSEPSNTSSVEQDESEDTEVSEMEEMEVSYADTMTAREDEPTTSDTDIVAVENSSNTPDRAGTATEEVSTEAVEEGTVRAKPDTATNTDGTVRADTDPVTAEVAEESPAEEENSNNDNSTTTIIIICGAVIVGVFAFLIVKQRKKKV